jgi:hypothetical protein
MKPEHREEIRNAVHDWMGIDLTEPQLDEILAVPRIKNEIEEWGVDTVARERIGKYLAMKIVGRPWPCYGDGEEAKNRFLLEFEERAPKSGYKLVEGAGA